MKLYTLALVGALCAFGISAEAQTCSTLCDEDFWKTESQAEVAAELSKADVSARDVRDRTALMFAAWYGTVENVKVLLDAGADLNARNDKGLIALMYAAGYGTVENVKFLLDAGADLNAREEYGKTALMYAAGYGTVESVKFLLDAGADLKERVGDGKTALMYAAGSGTVENVKVLSDEKLMPGLLNLDVTGERIYSYLNRRDTYSETALMFAARWGTAENVKFLLTIRAAHTSQLAVDGSLINSSGKTAFDLAENNEKLKNTDAYWLLSDARFK